MSALRRYRARLGAGGLLLLTVWEISVLVVARESAPTARDWQDAAATVRAAAGPDALVVFAPRWIDPVGRLWLGDRISPDQAARMDTARYRQVFELSIRGADALDVSGESAVTDQRFGQLRVRQFVRRAPSVSWTLTDNAHIHEVDFLPRKSVLFELGGAYDQQRLAFARVTLGAELHVYAGLADYKIRADNRATALLRVMVDGEEVARGTVGNESGWLALPVVATRPGTHDVEFVARVQDPRLPIHLALAVAAESRTPQP